MLKKIALLTALLSLLLVMVACGGQTEPAVVEVEVTRVVEGESITMEVTRIVEGESRTETVVVTATPDPDAMMAEAEVLAPGSVNILGAGATFPFPLYSRWFYEYAFVDPAVRFNYQSIGSGGGIRQITARTVDFGGSDALLTDEMKADAPGIIQIPIVAGAVVPIYNLNDANGDPIPPGMLLTGDILADIYLNNITRWDDERLQELNPDIALPDAAITVAHRSDGSGTTFLWVSYLAAISDEWRENVGVGTSVSWPVGLGGRGNEGVAGIVREQPNSIGYVEFAYAKQNNLSFAHVENQAGNFIEPTLESVVAASDALAADMPEDFGQLLTNAPGADSWPIAGYTFLLVYEDMPDCLKARKFLEFVRWAMSDEGSEYAFDLVYAPLGPGVQAQVEEQLDNMTCEGGQPIFGN